MHALTSAAGPTLELLWRDLLVTGLIKGTLLLAMAAAGCLALRRASAGIRHLVWSLALASLLILPVISTALPAWKAPVVSQAVSALAAALGDERPGAHAESALPVPQPQSATRARALRSPVPEAASAARPHRLAWLGTLWLGGALLVLARFSGGLLRLWWIARRSQVVTDRWLSLARELARQLGLARRVVLLESRDASVPLTWGVRRPTVLLPSGFSRWPVERIRIVLLHELVHVKRRDCATQLIAQLACALYWFNPLVWMAARGLRIERERACDEQVLGTGVRPSDYAAHLLEIARSLVMAPGTAAASVAMARPSQLEDRLLAILDHERSRSLSRLASALVVVVALCGIGPLAAMDVDAAGAPAAADRESGRADALIADLASKSWKVRKKAAQELARAGGSSAVEPLMAALSDPQWQVRKYAAFALIQIGDARAVEPLIAALTDTVWDVREQAAMALGEIGDPRAVEPLRNALTDADWHVREQATLALRRLRGTSPQAAPDEAVAALLRDPDWRVRQQTVLSLFGSSSPRSVDLLLGALGDEDWHVREVTAAVLGRLREPRAVEPLIAALGDRDPRIRGQAAIALGNIGDDRAVEPIEALLQDEVEDVREDARKALERLNG